MQFQKMSERFASRWVSVDRMRCGMGSRGRMSFAFFVARENGRKRWRRLLMRRSTMARWMCGEERGSKMKTKNGFMLAWMLGIGLAASVAGAGEIDLAPAD